MALDVFQRSTSNFGGAFTADRAKLIIPGAGNLGLLVQSLQVQYAQSVTRLYDITSDRIYYVGGRTQGQLQLARVIGPVGTLKGLYSCFGDVCRAQKNTLSLELKETNCAGNVGAGQPGSAVTINELQNGCTTPAANAATSSKYDIYFCVITQVGIGVQAQDMVINEQSQMMFSSMRLAS